MNEPTKFIELLPQEWKSDRPNVREPVFGPNAKRWFTHFAIGLFCVIFVLPWLRGVIKPYTDPAVESGFNVICSSIDLCTPEAAVRLNRSANQ